jgi:hypothetical protein
VGWLFSHLNILQKAACEEGRKVNVQNVKMKQKIERIRSAFESECKTKFYLIETSRSISMAMI